MGAWDTGRQLAGFLRDGDGSDRQAAARFFHAVALKWLAEGDHYAAGEAIQAAVKTFPEHRLALMDDPKLSECFLI